MSVQTILQNGVEVKAEPTHRNSQINEFRISELASLIGWRPEGVLSRIKSGRMSATQLKDQRRTWRIPREEAEQLIDEQITGAIPLLGLFVLASTSYQQGIITEQQYQAIRQRTLRQLSGLLKYPSARQLLDTLSEAENLDRLLWHLYRDAERLQR